MLWGTADGQMQTMFLIIKCSSQLANLSNTRVLHNLLDMDGFTASDGWELKTWQKDLKITIKKKERTVTYTIPYLIQSSTGHIITLQHRAWMDTARLCMWFDLQLGPHYAAKRGMAAWSGTIVGRTEPPQSGRWQKSGASRCSRCPRT